MSAEPITEPVQEPLEDPIDLLIALEQASPTPIRPEYVEGMVVVPPQPDFEHNDGAFDLPFQLRSAGFRFAGMGMGFRTGARHEQTRALVIPDFYVLKRKPTEMDVAHAKAHKGWYPSDLLALVGEVTSSNHETDTGPKLRAYAAASVPVYVLVHREEGHAYCYSDPVPDTERPERSHYATEVKVDLGRPLPLPAPYPPLETGSLVDTGE